MTGAEAAKIAHATGAEAQVTGVTWESVAMETGVEDTETVASETATGVTETATGVKETGAKETGVK